MRSGFCAQRFRHRVHRRGVVVLCSLDEEEERRKAREIEWNQEEMAYRDPRAEGRKKDGRSGREEAGKGEGTWKQE